MKLSELDIPLQSKQAQHKMFEKDSYCPDCGEAVVDDECTECEYDGPGISSPMGGASPQGGL